MLTIDEANAYRRFVGEGIENMGHRGVQLWEGGPFWAETNVGADQPWESGYHFWWGDTVGYKREHGVWVASDGSSSGFSFDEENTPTFGKGTASLKHYGWITEGGVLASEHDAAQVQWGGAWRMPTLQELEDLHDKCDWDWITLHGVGGFIVRGRHGKAFNSIFLPALAGATGLRSTMPVRSATTGRPNRAWTTATDRGTSTSIMATILSATAAATATTGGLFVPSYGSPYSERGITDSASVDSEALNTLRRWPSVRRRLRACASVCGVFDERARKYPVR